MRVRIKDQSYAMLVGLCDY